MAYFSAYTDIICVSLIFPQIDIQTLIDAHRRFETASRKTNNVINVVATISFFQKITKFFQFPFCIFGKSVIFCISDRTL